MFNKGTKGFIGQTTMHTTFRVSSDHTYSEHCLLQDIVCKENCKM